MEYKRVLVMQDISCVGQCSMTVALPVLSACGQETCIFPTAILSTHTGGFGKPEVVHLDNHLDAIWQHWRDNGITFDVVLVGYLGSVAAVETAQKVIAHMLAPDGVVIVDPAMADHGKLYSGLSEEYAEKMKGLCRRADIILPNITEAAYFAGMPYREQPDAEYVKDLLITLNHPCVILTGVGYAPEKTGVLVHHNGNQTHLVHDRIDRNFHGTGDLFAACFAGAFSGGKDMVEAAQIAADFVYESICNTVKESVHWYGIRFETALPNLIRKLHTAKATE